MRKRRPQKARKAEKLIQTFQAAMIKKSGEYVPNQPPKKPGGGEVYENNTDIM